MAKSCLYLVSSSASREYVLDCVEALAIPRGMILHFRYRSKYVDESLWELLPPEDRQLPSSLQGLPVVVVYLYQVQTVGVWKPGDTMGPGGPYLPLRCGRLINAFKDGEIAHFFFAVSGYVRPALRRKSTRELLNREISFKASGSKGARISYAHLSRDLGLDTTEVYDTASFQSIVDEAYLPGEWRTRRLGSAPLDVTYDIVFLRVAGIFHDRGGRITEIMPIRRTVRGSVFSQLELESGETYHMRMVTHLSARSSTALPGQGRVELLLVFDPNIIKPLSQTCMRISSLYDLEYWSFAVTAAQETRSVLSIACNFPTTINQEDFVRSELLCPEISIPVSIICMESKKRRGNDEND
jgi:hypothetical protein